MNEYLNYHIAKDRHNEYLRQAEKNRQFDRRWQNETLPVVRSLLSMLPTSRQLGLLISWPGTVIEKAGFGLTNFGTKLKSPEPS